MRVYGNAEESAWMAVASVLKMEMVLMIRIMCVLIRTAINTCNKFLFWISFVLPVWVFLKVRLEEQNSSKKTLNSVTKFL